MEDAKLPKSLGLGGKSKALAMRWTKTRGYNEFNGTVARHISL